MERPIPLRFACPKSWSELRGDGERRYCEICDLHVHNLSLMTPDRAQAFLAAREGRQCIAYRCDAKGDVVHANPTARRAQGFGRVGALLALCLAACRKAPAPAPTDETAAKEVAHETTSEALEGLQLMGY